MADRIDKVRMLEPLCCSEQWCLGIGGSIHGELCRTKHLTARLDEVPCAEGAEMQTADCKYQLLQNRCRVLALN